MPPPVTWAMARTSTAVEQRRAPRPRRSRVGASSPSGRRRVEAASLEHAADQREAVRVRAARRRGRRPRRRSRRGAVDEPVAARPRRRRSRRGRSRRRPYSPGMLGGLAAEQRAAGLAAAVGDALDERRDALRVEAADRDVVEEEQRPRARAEHVVDAHRDQVDARRVQRAAARVQAASFVPTPSVPDTSSRSPSRRRDRPAKPPATPSTPGRRVDAPPRPGAPTIASAASRATPAAAYVVLRHPTGVRRSKRKPAALAQLGGNRRRVALASGRRGRSGSTGSAGRATAGPRARGRRASRRRATRAISSTVRLRGDQLVAVGHVDAVVAGRHDRRRRDAQVHLRGAGVAQHLDDLARGRAAHDRVVDHHHALAARCTSRERVELQLARRARAGPARAG